MQDAERTTCNWAMAVSHLIYSWSPSSGSLNLDDPTIQTQELTPSNKALSSKTNVVSVMHPGQSLCIVLKR